MRLYQSIFASTALLATLSSGTPFLYTHVSRDDPQYNAMVDFSPPSSVYLT